MGSEEALERGIIAMKDHPTTTTKKKNYELENNIDYRFYLTA
jgi:hypothetical protein